MSHCVYTYCLSFLELSLCLNISLSYQCHTSCFLQFSCFRFCLGQKKWSRMNLEQGHSYVHLMEYHFKNYIDLELICYLKYCFQLCKQVLLLSLIQRWQFEKDLRFHSRSLMKWSYLFCCSLHSNRLMIQSTCSANLINY